jgi:hypothetical protein
MAKRALCVGINDYPGTDNDLAGCVNDARAWAQLLRERYDFPPAGVRVLLDAEATRAGILAGLDWLLAGARAGDQLVFTNSSHGTYVADESGDEAYDEALCPFDAADGLILDDELRVRFARLPEGVSLTMIADNCHSGTITRAGAATGTAAAPADDERRARFLNPAAIGRRVLADPWKAKKLGSASALPQAGMKELLLSGCSPREYSYDARFDGRSHGAMSYFALRAIEEADGELTWAQLHARLRELLDEAGYPQHPQLEGRPESKKRRVFA